MKPRQVRLSHREMQSRYIPEMVLEQLRFHLTAFPDDLRRMLILLLESGMRLSDLCSLSYDCLAQDVAGKPFLRYLELKTKRVRAIPLSPLALEVILEQQQELKGIENGDGRFLFPDPNGRPSSAQIFMKKLNQQASEKNICDATGTVWRFYAHQIRSTILWRLFMAGPSIMTQFLHHATIEVQPQDLLPYGADSSVFKIPAVSPSFGCCRLESFCPHTFPYPYAPPSIPQRAVDELEVWVQDNRKWLLGGDKSQEEVDELQEIEEYGSDSEPLLFEFGHMHCIACERRKTVPGSLLCQECIDKQKTFDRESNREPQRVPLFELGRIIATRGAIEVMERRGIDYNALLARHVTGDWGDLVEEDKYENQIAVKHGQRIHSAYGTQGDPDRLWIITEPDRHATTILLPDEY